METSHTFNLIYFLISVIMNTYYKSSSITDRGDQYEINRRD